jgi:hypothetical protein
MASISQAQAHGVRAYLLSAAFAAKLPECNASSTGAQRSTKVTAVFAPETASDFAQDAIPKATTARAAASTILLRI